LITDLLNIPQKVVKGECPRSIEKDNEGQKEEEHISPNSLFLFPPLPYTKAEGNKEDGCTKINKKS
jgi:hypothetical protein